MHNIRDNEGVVTCTYLSGIECRYCHDMGHTIKYCSVLKKKKNDYNGYNNSITTNVNRNNGFIVVQGKERRSNSEVVVVGVAGEGQMNNSIFECLEIEGDVEGYEAIKSDDDSEAGDAEASDAEAGDAGAGEIVDGGLKINWGAKSTGKWGDEEDD